MATCRALLLVGALAFSASPALGQQFPATLAGHAVLPAATTFVDAPADVPESLRTSGKYTGPGNRRVD
jgi:hypothetical protein